VRYARRPAAGRYLLVLALLVLGLMSKPMLVTWPFVMLLLDWWPLERLRRETAARLLVEKLPCFALVLGSCVVTWLAQRPAMHLMQVVPLGHRLQNAAASGLSYLGKTVWPSGLAVLYPYRTEIPALLTVGAVLLLAVATTLALRSAARSPWLFVGWSWFLGTLLPVSGLVQVGLHSMADRYTYVPHVGLFILLVWGAAELVRRGPASRWAAPAAAAMLVALAFGSARQVRHWADTESLFRHTCAVTQDNGWAHRILGTALSETGRPEEGVREIGIALRQWPDDPIAHNNLGYALARLGRDEDALREYREAVRLDPDELDYRANLGGALLRSGRMTEAINVLREAVRLRPDLASTHADLGKALALAGQHDEAIGELRQALRIQPGDAALHHVLAVALDQHGRTDEAIAELREALRLEPDSAAIRDELAALLATVPDPAEGGRAGD